MNFTNTLIKGKLIKRYKRFFVDIKANNSIVTAHCPNTGSMIGLLDKGNNVWLTKNDDPKRKLKFTLEIIEVNKILIGVPGHPVSAMMIFHKFVVPVIRRLRGEKDIFVHFSEIKEEGYKTLRDGEKVEFEIEDSDNDDETDNDNSEQDNSEHDNDENSDNNTNDNE